MARQFDGPTSTNFRNDYKLIVRTYATDERNVRDDTKRFNRKHVTYPLSKMKLNYSTDLIVLKACRHKW